MKISKKEAGNGPIFKEIRKKHLQSMIEVQRQEIQEREIDVTFRSKKRESVFERLSYTKEHRMKRNVHHSRCTERERERTNEKDKIFRKCFCYFSRLPSPTLFTYQNEDARRVRSMLSFRFSDILPTWSNVPGSFIRGMCSSTLCQDLM